MFLLLWTMLALQGKARGAGRIPGLERDEPRKRGQNAGAKKIDRVNGGRGGVAVRETKQTRRRIMETGSKAKRTKGAQRARRTSRQ